jgi:hypothetical protein
LIGILLDAFRTKCSKCTETQKSSVRKAVKFFLANRAEQWQKVVQAYDPTGKYSEEFKEFLLAA